MAFFDFLVKSAKKKYEEQKPRSFFDAVVKGAKAGISDTSSLLSKGGFGASREGLGFTKDVGQLTARSGAKVGLDISKSLGGATSYKPSGVGKALFGEEEVRPLSTEIAERYKEPTLFGKEAGEGQFSRFASALAPLALTAADFTGSGGARKKTLQEAAKVGGEIVEASKGFKFTRYKGGPSDTISSFAKTIDGMYESQGAGVAVKKVDKLYGSVADRNEQITSLANTLNENFRVSMKFKRTKGTKVGELLEKIPDKELTSGTTETLVRKYGADSEMVEAAKSIRQHYVETLEQVNKARVARGQEAIPARKNYMTHMVELIKEGDAGSGRGLISDEKFNPSALARAKNLQDYEKNVYKTLDVYNRRVANEIHLTPAIKEMKELQSALTKDGNTSGAEFVGRYIKEGLLGETPAADAAIGLMKGSKAYNVVQRINMARSLGGIVGNLRFLTVTQPASLSLAVGKAGPKNFLKGVFNYLTDPALRKEIKELNVVRLKSSQNIGTTAGGQLDFQKGTIYKTRIQSFNDVLGSASNWLEKHITGISASAGKQRARQIGLKGKDQDMFAGHIAEVTQSMYSPETRAQLLNNISIRAGFPFQTFAFESYRHLKNIAGKGTGGIPLEMSKRFQQGIGLVVSTMLYNYMTEKTTGSKVTTPGSTIPLAGNLLDRSLKAVGVAKDAPDRPTTAPEADIEKLTRGIGDFAKDGDTTKLRQLLIFWGTGLAGLGGGAQVSRMVDGLISVMEGESRTPSGNKRFDVEPGFDSFKAILYGPYSTKGGQEYVKSLGETESAKKKKKGKNEVLT